MPGRAVWEDPCFRVEEEGGHYWITELLHPSEGGVVKEDVPKRWDIRFDDADTARRWIGGRLRDSHDNMHHFHAPQAVVGQ